MTTKSGIIYLQKDRFHLYSPYLPNILEFRFVPELIRDFDLINKELLENLLKVFIANNKVLAGSVVIIVGDNASFIKDFVSPPVNPASPPTTPPPTLEDLQNAANQYVEQVPFDLVAGKTFPLATGVRAYATNQDVYEAIKGILEKQGFIVEAVLPGFPFGPEVSAKPALDGQSVAIIMQKFGTVREYNLLKEAPTIVESTLPPEGEVEVEEKSSGSKIPLKNTKLTNIIAIAAIAVIVIVTGVILYQQSTEKPYKAPPPGTTKTQPTTVSVAPSQPAANPTTTVILDVKALTVQITTVSSSATTAENVRAALTPYGFKSITTQTDDTLGSSQALVIFSPNVQTPVRTTITEQVKKVLGDVLIQEKSDTISDIVIILGK